MQVPFSPQTTGLVSVVTTNNSPSSVAALRARMQQRREDTAFLHELWQELFEDMDIPANHQFKNWLLRYDVETVAHAFEQSAKMVQAKAQQGKDTDTMDIIKYASKVMSNEAAKDKQ